MDYKKKTKAELINEIESLRRQVAILEKRRVNGQTTEPMISDTEGEIITPSEVQPPQRTYGNILPGETEDMMRASVARLRAILNSGFQSIVFISPDQKIQAFNNIAGKNSRRMFGKTMTVGDLIYDYVSPEERTDFQNHLNNALQGEPVRVERCLIGSSGSEHWFEFFYNPVMGDNGEIIGVCLTIMPITERKRAEAERARFINQLRTAAEVSNQLTAILNIEQLLYNVVTLLQSRFELYHVHVYLLDISQNNLVMRVGSGEVGRQMRRQGHHIHLHSEQSLVARAARTGNIVAVDNVHKEAGYLANPLLPKTQTELAIPLIAGDKVLGVLDVQDNMPYRFTQSDIDVFYTLAAQIATALHNAQLFQEQKRGEEILHRYASRLEALRRIDRDILAAQSSETIAQVALNHIWHMLPCRRASVVEFNLERQEANLLAVFTGNKTKMEVEEILPPEAFNTKMLQQGRIHVVHDIQTVPEPTPLELDILAEGFRSYINVPLMVQGKLIGSLNIGSDKPDSFTADHLDIAEEVSISLAIAIQQARLYEQARQDAETKANLLHEVNHRVKNNLAAIVGLLYIEQQHTGMTEQPTYRAIMTDLINRIEGLTTVHQMLSDSHWSPLLLSDLTQQIIQSVVKALPADRQVSTNVTAPIPVYVNPQQANSLAMVINEMVTNTVKYALISGQTASISVNITLKEKPPGNLENNSNDSDNIQIEYRDNGPGFPKTVLQSEYQNVGLYLIHNIVRRDLRGKVILDNDNGARITIRFKGV